MFDSLRNRLIASFTMLVVFSLILSSFIFALVLQQNNQQNAITQLTDEALINTQYLPAALHTDPRLDDLKLTPQARAKGYELVVLDAQSHIIHFTGGNVSIMTVLPNTDMSGGPGSGQTQTGMVTLLGHSYLFAAVPLNAGGHGGPMMLQLPDGTLAPAVGLALLQNMAVLQARTTSELVSPIVISFLISLFLSVLAAVMISRSIARPLQQISQAAGELARGHFRPKLPQGEKGEIGQLASSFDHMARELERSDRVQRDFVANVSHELRSPLTSISGFSQAMLDGSIDDPEGVSRAAEIISEESQRLIRLTSDLLDLARLESGQIVLNPQAVELDTLLLRCLDHMDERAADKHITIDRTIAPMTPPANLDADRTIQIMTNLLDNAIKFSPEYGMVRASLTTDGRTLVLAIANRGAPMQQEQLDRVFDRFYQTDPARTHNGRAGFGLGLPIVKELVEAQQGTVRATYTDGWITFTVHFPVATQAPHPPRQSDSHAITTDKLPEKLETRG